MKFYFFLLGFFFIVQASNNNVDSKTTTLFSQIPLQIRLAVLDFNSQIRNGRFTRIVNAVMEHTKSPIFVEILAASTKKDHNEKLDFCLKNRAEIVALKKKLESLEKSLQENPSNQDHRSAKKVYDTFYATLKPILTVDLDTILPLSLRKTFQPFEDQQRDSEISNKAKTLIGHIRSNVFSNLIRAFNNNDIKEVRRFYFKNRDSLGSLKRNFTELDQLLKKENHTGDRYAPEKKLFHAVEEVLNDVFVPGLEKELACLKLMVRHNYTDEDITTLMEIAFIEGKISPIAVNFIEMLLDRKEIMRDTLNNVLRTISRGEVHDDLIAKTHAALEKQGAENAPNAVNTTLDIMMALAAKK